MDCDFVSWRGHRIHVTVTGDGEPLLLVPGLGNNVDMWTGFMAQFKQRRIIRLDAPGTGLSVMTKRASTAVTSPRTASHGSGLSSTNASTPSRREPSCSALTPER